MLPTVLMPDVTLWATDYLRDALAGRPEPYTGDVFVAGRVPASRRDRMVIIRRDGGAKIDSVRESARLGINVWATSEQEANDLARMVRALLWAAPDGNPVVRVDDRSGPSPIPDESKQSRVYLVVEVVVRGENLGEP